MRGSRALETVPNDETVLLALSGMASECFPQRNTSLTSLKVKGRDRFWRCARMTVRSIHRRISTGKSHCVK